MYIYIHNLPPSLGCKFLRALSTKTSAHCRISQHTDDWRRIPTQSCSTEGTSSSTKYYSPLLLLIKICNNSNKTHTCLTPSETLVEVMLGVSLAVLNCVPHTVQCNNFWNIAISHNPWREHGLFLVLCFLFVLFHLIIQNNLVDLHSDQKNVSWFRVICL